MYHRGDNWNRYDAANFTYPQNLRQYSDGYRSPGNAYYYDGYGRRYNDARYGYRSNNQYQPGNNYGYGYGPGYRYGVGYRGYPGAGYGYRGTYVDPGARAGANVGAAVGGAIGGGRGVGVGAAIGGAIGRGR
jgi:hypothetical protein